MTAEKKQAQSVRGGSVVALRVVEQSFYVAVAGALAVAGAILFVWALYEFVRGFAEKALPTNVLELLDTLLLVFIITELIHTVHAVIRQNELLTEPFLIIGIVAVIRRLIVISAEARDLAGTEQFSDILLEMAILVAAVVLLGLTIFLMRRTSQPEPSPSHEQGATEGKDSAGGDVS